MDAKLNHSDLSALLAKQAEISGAKAEAFTKAFFDILLEGLEKDGMVKINGLGTFKVTEVASRSSVDVNTGEKIEIKGHRKLNFLPADALKEKVNQPFAMFEPVEIDDSYVDDSEEGDADDTLTQESATAQTATETEDITPTEQGPNVHIELQNTYTDGGAPEEVASQSQEAELPATEEPAVLENVAEETTEQPQATSATESEKSEMSDEEPVAATEEREEEQPIAETSAQLEVKNSYPITEPASGETPEKEKSSTLSYTLYILAAILVAVVVYFYYSHNSSVQTKQPLVAVATPVAQTTNNTAKQQPATAATVAEPAPVPEEKPYTFTMLDELAAKSVGSVGRGDTLLYVADGSIATHTVAADETLVRIALKYYGDKRLWPYIVQHNKLHNPNGLNKGMELQIPRLQPAK